jgi:thiamine-monophosphate kinase
LALRGVAHACIDLSDGLASDLKHILKRSRVGACVEWAALPLSAEVRQYIERTGDWMLPLTAGDDYELCFTVPPERAAQLVGEFRQIGVIEAESGLRIARAGRIEPLEAKGFEHFS